MHSPTKKTTNKTLTISHLRQTWKVISNTIQNHLHPIFNKPIFVFQNRGVEQLVARRAHNPKVVGSSPASATNKAC